jgi:membrane protein
VAFSVFASLLPLLVVGIAVVGFVSHGRDDFANSVIERLGLTGSAADLFTDAIAASEDARATTSIIGLVLLLITGLGLGAAVKDICDAAWQVADRGLRVRLRSMEWAVGSFVLLGVSITASSLANPLPGWFAPIAILISAFFATMAFVWTFFALTAVRIPVRAHLPGAAIGGIAFTLITTFGTTYLTNRIASSSALFGTLGVILAVLAWFYVFGYLLVYAAVLNVVVYEHDHGTRTVGVTVPEVDGMLEHSEQTTRGGAFDTKTAKAVAKEDADDERPDATARTAEA